MSDQYPVVELLTVLTAAGWRVEESEPGAFSAGAPGSSNGDGEWVALASDGRGGLATGQAIIATTPAFAALLPVLESSRGALPPGLNYSGFDDAPLSSRPLIEGMALCARERGWAQASSIPDSWSWRWGSRRHPRAFVVILGDAPAAMVGATCRFIVHFQRPDEMRGLASALTTAWSDRQVMEERLSGAARVSARYLSRCSECRSTVRPGEPIFRMTDHWMHYECAAKLAAD